MNKKYKQLKREKEQLQRKMFKMQILVAYSEALIYEEITKINNMEKNEVSKDRLLQILKNIEVINNFKKIIRF